MYAKPTTIMNSVNKFRHAFVEPASDSDTARFYWRWWVSA